jgi:predicted NAD/FAD-binding protein
VKAGFSFGATDDLGYQSVVDPMSVHDLHATILHLLGFDHLRLTYEWNRIRLEAKGDTFTEWLNGQQVSQYTSEKYREPAPIGLQIWSFPGCPTTGCW